MVWGGVGCSVRCESGQSNGKSNSYNNQIFHDKILHKFHNGKKSKEKRKKSRLRFAPSPNITDNIINCFHNVGLVHQEGPRLEVVVFKY